jgi:hypothetical protein
MLFTAQGTSVISRFKKSVVSKFEIFTLQLISSAQGAQVFKV